MPELPEVESIRRDLQTEVAGRRIRSAGVGGTPNALRIIRRHGDRHGFEEALCGRNVESVQRKGKYLILFLDGGRALVVHLGMSGQMLLSAPEAPLADHTHVVLDLDNRRQLRFVDPRSFGQMFVADCSERGEIAELAHLGNDPLGRPMTRQAFFDALGRRKAGLKSLLMDQSFICGIGNIYSDEMLFASGLRHDRASNSLSCNEMDRLYEAVGEILGRAVAGRGTSMRDQQYRDLYGATGGYGECLKVYQREGRPCVRCQTPIRRARWSNRSTHYCPVCQI